MFYIQSKINKDTYYVRLGRIQMNRLFEILYILLQRRCVTAKELSERFEVSVRTIYRDVDALSMAGIPVYMKKGRYGGIYLLDNFVMDKSLVSLEEQKDILTALESVSLVENGHNEAVINKLRSVFNVKQTNWLSMDFSDWSNQRQEMYENLKYATINYKKLHFNYYNREGIASRRYVCPLQLWFKDYTWYLKAYCLEKEDIRIFKLIRMQQVEVSQESFEKDYPRLQECLEHYERNENEPGNNFYQPLKNSNTISIKLWIDKCKAYQVYDIYDEAIITRLKDGNFIIQGCILLDEWVYRTILSFGPYAKVLEPASLQKSVKQMLHDSYQLYV